MIFHFQHCETSVSELCDQGAQVPAHRWLVELDFSLSWGLDSRWAGEIQAFCRLREPYPYISILLSSRQKVIPNTNSEGFLIFCNLRCTSLSLWCACLHWRTAVSLSRLYVSSSSISSVWAKDTVCSAASAAAFRQHQLSASDSEWFGEDKRGRRGRNLPRSQFWHGTSDIGWFSCHMFKVGHAYLL